MSSPERHRPVLRRASKNCAYRQETGLTVRHSSVSGSEVVIDLGHKFRHGNFSSRNCVWDFRSLAAAESNTLGTVTS
jgi:hypothetical protein